MDSTAERTIELGRKIAAAMDGYTHEECLTALAALMDMLLGDAELHEPGGGVAIWRGIRERMDASLQGPQP